MTSATEADTAAMTT